MPPPASTPTKGPAPPAGGAAQSAAATATATSTTTTTTPTATTETRLNEIFSLLRKGAEQRDATLVLRALRRTTAVRRTATAAELDAAIRTALGSAQAVADAGVVRAKESMLEVLREAAAVVPIPPVSPRVVPGSPRPSHPKKQLSPGSATPPMDDVRPTPLPDPSDVAAAPSSSTAPQAQAQAQAQEKPAKPYVPEIEAHLHLLVLRTAWAANAKAPTPTFIASAKLAVERAATWNRRTLDVLAAKAWQLYVLATERAVAAAAQSGNADALAAANQQQQRVRDEVLAAHRRACVSLDEAGQAALVNLILRDLVRRDQVSLAAKFAAKATFPDRAANNQHARYLYYLGRVEALQLEYGRSLAYLQQAIRKTSSSGGRSGLGFRVALHKLCSVVLLLTGEMPDRQWFADKDMSRALAPYLDLAKAVKSGSVATFEACRDRHTPVFAKDRTLTLVLRLHSSVIKTGLKAINAAYARVSFADVAAKLALESADAAEYVCAKAIRDGVLDATIDADAGCLVYAESVDLYASTAEPLKAYHRRVNFLLDAHNDAVKALRFPPEAYKSITKTLDDGGPGEDEELDVDKLDDLDDLDDGMDDD